MGKYLLSVLLILVFLSGCATANKPLNTTTGKPEIIINGVSKKNITDTIINQMLSWDFQIQKQTESILVFNKQDKRLGPNDDIVPEWIFTYNLVDYGNGVRVVANIASVKNPGTAFERITESSKGSEDAQNIQSFFENMKKLADQQVALKSRGKVGITFDAKNIITAVAKDSPAEKAGILPGDIILKIDGEPLSEDQFTNSMRISGSPGSTVILLIKRNEQDLTIPIIRGNP